MKQLVQSVGDGELRVGDLPVPTPGTTEVLVATRRSLVSSGTEQAVRQLAESSLLQKARARPDLVKQVLRKVSTDGARATLQSVRSRLDEDMPLGYSAAGVVVSAGEGAPALPAGTRVATASAGHGEMQVVPGLLAIPIPENVSDEEAAFGAVAAIAMQGLRQADVAPGGAVCVVGLGLVGQLTARLAMAAGLDVIGVDVNEDACRRLSDAGGLGLVEDGADATDAIQHRTRQRGVDAVIITAATKSSEPVQLACDRVRDRGTIVIVGDVGLELSRTPFYEKEIDLRFARSYGPGRYERTYEEYAVDYPIGHVRWTEGRNIEAYLDLVSRGRVAVADLVTHVFPITEAARAYDTIKSDRSSLAVQFEYDHPPTVPKRRPLPTARKGVGPGASALIGAGNFARATFMPALQAAGWPLPVAVTSSTGLSARHLAERHGIRNVAPDAESILADDSISTVFILSRHDSHAELTARALRAGKNVFVEKPLAITEQELDEVEAALSASEGHLWVGFNRRYSAITSAIISRQPPLGEPRTATYRIGAGQLPSTHWYKDRRQGGRLMGEVCHFVDLISWLFGANPTSVYAVGDGRTETVLQENLALALRYSNGSLATITYAEHGHPATPKERLDILGRGHTATIDDFESLSLDGRTLRNVPSGKGHAEGLRAFDKTIRGERDAQLDLDLSLGTTRAMFDAIASLGSLHPLPGSGPTDDSLT